MTCSTGKQCYSKREAQSKLNDLISSGKWSKKDGRGRIYQCPDCNLYHLTSLMSEGKTDMRGMVISFKKRWKKLLKNQNK